MHWLAAEEPNCAVSMLDSGTSIRDSDSKRTMRDPKRPTSPDSFSKLTTLICLTHSVRLDPQIWHQKNICGITLDVVRGNVMTSVGLQEIGCGRRSLKNGGRCPSRKSSGSLGQCGGAVFRVMADTRAIRRPLVTVNMDFLVCVL